MTVFATKHVHPSPRERGAVTVRWVLSRAGSRGPCTLAVVVEGDVVTASLLAEGETPVVVAQGRAVVTGQAGADGLIEHIDAAGVVSLSLRRGAVGNGGVELLYARTPLLAVLGVPGGCADRPELAEA